MLSFVPKCLHVDLCACLLARLPAHSYPDRCGRGSLADVVLKKKKCDPFTHPQFIPAQVLHSPQHEVCVCVYCANADLSALALQNVTGVDRRMSNLKELCLCTSPSTQCFLGACRQFPMADNLTMSALGVSDEEDVTYAVWEIGSLIKKSLPPAAFVKELGKWVTKWISHDSIRRTQAIAINEAKRCERRSSIVLHFDFSENWTVILPNEVQSYHWHKTQVSLFTCVVTTRKSVQSFAVVSDHMQHDTAHACYALAPQGARMPGRKCPCVQLRCLR